MAVIGLVGVLGGVAIGAIAAIYGPSRLHKRQSEEKLTEDAASKIASEIERLVAFRATGSAWLDALERVAGDVDAGRAIDLDTFDALIEPLSGEAAQWAYRMIFDNRWVASQPVGPIAAPLAGSDATLLGVDGHMGVFRGSRLFTSRERSDS